MGKWIRPKEMSSIKFDIELTHSYRKRNGQPQPGKEIIQRCACGGFGCFYINDVPFDPYLVPKRPMSNEKFSKEDQERYANYLRVMGR